MQKIRIVWFFFENRHIGRLNFGWFYFYYVPAAKPFDYAWFEVLESIDHAWFEVLESIDHAWFEVLESLDHAWFEVLESLDHAWFEVLESITLYRTWSETSDLKES
jgi:hypothetical protein